MRDLHVEVEIDAPPEQVWAAVADVASHVEWMADAEAIRFLGERRQGPGTEFECDTRVGPFTTTDVMRVVEWEPTRALGIVHRGVVTGSGRFTLHPLPGGRTRFAWDERLRFPWFMGGGAGATLARPVLRRVWQGNLARLRRRIEDGGSPA